MNTIKITKSEVLSDDWYVLNKISFEVTHSDGTVSVQTREAYDRGNGATILLYNTERRSVILTRQFRMPTFINGNKSGYMIECCAGLLDKDNPEDCIRKETEEETGFRIEKINKVFEAYMSPGSVTELIYFFTAEYAAEMKVSAGGGLKAEDENIEVLEIHFERALEMIISGEIKDGKTIMLLQHAAIHKLLG